MVKHPKKSGKKERFNGKYHMRSESKTIRKHDGKIVYAKKSANGKKNAAKKGTWANAVKQARKEMHIKGFVPIGGKSKEGKELLKTAREIYKE